MYLRQDSPEAYALSPSNIAGHDAGEMAPRIRAFDWSITPLGPLEAWPQSLRTVVNILLSSRYAMWMAWGPELTMLYNDAYRPTLGIKHSWALGCPANEVWAEIWGDIGPRIQTVLTTGKATYDEGLLLFLERSGFPEETYHTFSYSPLSDDAGRINGMLCVVTEETERLIGERRAATLHEVASALATANTEMEVLQALTDKLAVNGKDLPFTLTYLFDDAGNARLVSCSGLSAGHPLAAERIERGSDFPWPANLVRLHPAVRLVDDLSEQRKAAPLPTGDWTAPAERAVAVPLRQQGQEGPAGFFVVGTNPYRRYDAAYSGFINLLAGQLAAGLGNARANEAERRRAEALAELDRAKTTFFSNVSHELRTPLTLMLNPLEELLSEVKDKTPKELELLGFAHRNGLRLQKLVNTLLDFSRIEAGRMEAVYEPVNLGRLTEDLAANFRSAMEKAGLAFNVKCEVISDPIYVDREMWEKVVLNLISNALKFTLVGSVTVTLRRMDNQVEFGVRDTGIGIPENEVHRVFERFHRIEGAAGRTIEGTGIGLALVQELVKLHDGTIQVSSELNVGSTFTVRIPTGTRHLPKERIRVGGPSAPTTPQSKTIIEETARWFPSPSDIQREVAGADGAVDSRVGVQKILLADDNADMRDYLTHLLGQHYKVVAVSNGVEALEFAESESPDLILSDVMMPELDGFGLLKALRQNPETRTIPVILLSARAGEESKVEGLRGGADDYLVKPFSTGELFARVGALLSMRRIREESEAALRASQETLRRSNNELRRANADLEQFAYSASHDLQEPLRQVALYSQLLEKRYANQLEGKGLEYLTYCVDGAHRMEMLINDLLAYSEVTRGAENAAQPVDTNAVLAEVTKNLAVTIDESRAIVSWSNLPVLLADAVPIAHLFQNLISNALKYRSVDPPRIEISATDVRGSWQFSVRDNGIGIPEEFQNQIFGMFKRLHSKKDYPGTGVGLAICQKIVERCGGRIWVESEPGQGSTFLFTFPMAPVKSESR